MTVLFFFFLSDGFNHKTKQETHSDSETEKKAARNDISLLYLDNLASSVLVWPK